MAFASDPPIRPTQTIIADLDIFHGLFARRLNVSRLTKLRYRSTNGADAVVKSIADVNREIGIDSQASRRRRAERRLDCGPTIAGKTLLSVAGNLFQKAGFL